MKKIYQKVCPCDELIILFYVHNICHIHEKLILGIRVSIGLQHWINVGLDLTFSNPTVVFNMANV